MFSIFSFLFKVTFGLFKSKKQLIVQIHLHKKEIENRKRLIMRRPVVLLAKQSICTLFMFILLAFLPITSFSQSFSFVTTSDQREYAGEGIYDTSSYYRGAIEALASVGPGEFMVVIGDMDPVYGTNWTIEQVLGTDYIWYPVVGNHELPYAGNEDYPGSNMDYVREMNPNGTTLPNIVNPGPSGAVETCYSFDYANCHFIVINEYYDGDSDVGTDGDITDALYNWLAADLAATSQTHIFIFGHEPGYPQPDVDTGRIRHEYDSLNQYPENFTRFWQLMSNYGVLAFLAGHTHNYSLYNLDDVWQIETGHT